MKIGHCEDGIGIFESSTKRLFVVQISLKDVNINALEAFGYSKSQTLMTSTPFSVSAMPEAFEGSRVTARM